MEKVHNIAEAIITKTQTRIRFKVRLHFNPTWTKFSDLTDNNHND